MNEKLNIQDLVNILAEKHGMDKKDADVFVREFFVLIEQALDSDKYVKVKGLGTFKLIEVGSRESVNVNTGERFKIEGHTKISFTPDTALRDLINKPFAHFETVVLNENTVLEDTALEDSDDENVESEKSSLVSEELNVIADSVPASEPVVGEMPIAHEEILKEKEEVTAEQNDFSEVEIVEESQESLAEETPKEEKLSTEEIIARELRESADAGRSDIEPIKTAIPENTETVDNKLKKEDKTPVAYLVTIIVVVLLLCGGALAYVYYPEIFSFVNKEQKTEIEASLDATMQNIPLDTVQKAKVDTVAEVIAKKQEVMSSVKEPQKTVKDGVTTPGASQAALPVKPDSVNYTIVGTKTLYTIKEGETLTRVSLRFYGTKDLWPYIVKHNRDIIKNPDSVPYGTTLKIPELTKK
ncbi:HU family DNA-binding protein [Bacteroides sp.]